MDYKCTFDVSGRVLEVGQTQTFGSGFTKRTIIIEASKDETKFSNPVMVTLKRDNCALADSIGVGDGVVVTGYVEGRRWEGNGNGARYFIDLAAKSIMVAEKGAPAKKPTTAGSWDELAALGSAYGEDAKALTVRCKSKFPGKGSAEYTASDWQAVAAEVVAAHTPKAEEQDNPDFGSDMPF